MPMIYGNGNPAPERITQHHSLSRAETSGKDTNKNVKVKLDCGCPNATAKYAIIPPEVFQDALINDTPQRQAFADPRIRGQIGNDGTPTARQSSEPPNEFKVSDLSIAAQQAVAKRIIPFMPAWGAIRQERVDLNKAERPEYREWLLDHGLQDPTIDAETD